MIERIFLPGATVYASIKHGLTQRFKGAWPHYSGLKAKTDENGKMNLVLLGGQGEIEVGTESTDNVILIVPDYVVGGGDKYPINKTVVSESHVFDKNLTVKSILTAALNASDGGPDPILDRLDGRKAWGMRNERDECKL